MYALIESGGQQHKVEPGRYVTINRLAVEEGGAVVFDRVLLVRTDGEIVVGTPAVEGAEVRGRVRRHLRGKKVYGFKYQAKKGYRRRWGARADLTQVTVDSILFGGETFTAAAEQAPAAAATEE
ncbi:MAG: 50S ribosomal protein L21 [Armatimonadetes bacterium]|nr:50S ribosomal protein L21 [Armatimonadota bacterium]